MSEMTVKKMSELSGSMRLAAALLLIKAKGCDKMPYTVCELGPGMCDSCIADLAMRPNMVPKRGTQSDRSEKS